MNLKLLLLLVVGISGSSVNFQIIHTNDLHAWFMGSGPSSRGTGSFSRISTVVKGLQSRSPNNTLTVDAGDICGGSIYQLISVSSQFRFYPEYEFLVDLKYDATTIGNHDFNGRMEILVDRLRKVFHDSSDIGTLPVVVSNVKFQEEHLKNEFWRVTEDFTLPLTSLKKTNISENKNKMINRPFLTPFILKTLKTNTENLKVGIIGLLGPSSLEIIPSILREGLEFVGYDDFHSQTDRSTYHKFVESFVTDLRKRYSLDVILALSHSGWDDDIQLLNSFSGQKRIIDVLISSHTHPQKSLFKIISSNGAIATLNRAYGQEIGYLKLSYDFSSQSVHLRKNSRIEIDSTYPEDPFWKTKIQNLNQLIEEVYFSNPQHFDPSLKERLNVPTSFLTAKTRGEFSDIISDYLFEQLNLELSSSSNNMEVDTFIIVHSWVRVYPEMMQHFLNHSLNYIDLYNWIGPVLETNITKDNFRKESIAIYELSKSQFFGLLTLSDLLGKNSMRSFSFGGITYKKRWWGIPFLQNERFGRIYDIRINGKRLLSDDGKKRIRVASRVTMFYLIPLIKQFSKGWIVPQVFDRFGRMSNAAEKYTTKYFDVELLHKCIKRKYGVNKS